jgi:hypothetical protein
MDGSLRTGDMVTTLEAALLSVSSYAEVRVVVRAWAAERWFLPCTTTPFPDSLRIAYHDVEGGCKQFRIPLTAELAARYLIEYEAGQGGW